MCPWDSQFQNPKLNTECLIFYVVWNELQRELTLKKTRLELFVASVVAAHGLEPFSAGIFLLKHNNDLNWVPYKPHNNLYHQCPTL